MELGQLDKTFRLEHTDPWLRGDAWRTSRTLQVLNNRTSGSAIHGRADNEPGEEEAGGARPRGAARPLLHAARSLIPSPLSRALLLACSCCACPAQSSLSSPLLSPPPQPHIQKSTKKAGGTVVLARAISGLEFRRPLSSTGWSGTLGASWQRTHCLDEHGRELLADCYGGPLTFSGAGHDTSLTTQATAAYSSPRDASALFLSLEQALPLRQEWLNFSRARLRVERPLALGGSGATLNLRSRAGGIIGDLPPYEAFPIGGTNSVR